MKLKNIKVKVLGTIGNFQIFNDEKMGKHIILIVGQGPNQYEHSVPLKKSSIANMKKKIL